ncbi:MAG: PLDc N-terminal domain-containing protein, partial [Clostridia bacterium]|nr:PLDc N-terminal domain-containing protein [Clostridia bacterium]
MPKKKQKRRNILRPLVRILFSRVVLVALLIVIQLVLVAVGILQFTEHYYILVSVSSVIAFLGVCHIISTDFNPGYKIAWIVVVFFFQPVGVGMYYIFSANTLSKKVKLAMSRITSITETLKEDKSDVLRALSEENPGAGRQAAYIDRMSMCPPYTHTETKYFPNGEAFLEALLPELERAERYIFLEYFIIGHGIMWEKIRSVLTRKAVQGVDVRVIYDDFGSITRLHRNYPKELRAQGIKCHVFHPFVPVLDARQNNRDH